jgi:hypothetical protein
MAQTKKLSEPVLILISKRPLTRGEVLLAKEVIGVLSDTRKAREMAAVDNRLIIGLRPRYPKKN